MWGVIFEATILRWVVGRRDYNAISEILFSIAVVYQNRPRDNWRRRNAVALLNQRLNLVGGQHLERRTLRWTRERVRVLAHEQRTRGALDSAVVANGLCDSKNVRLIERNSQGRAAVPAGSEVNRLIRIVYVGARVKVGAFKLSHIDQ